ncbi:MAG: SRPBCC family protein [Gemmatimonadales bacterium]
MRAVRIVAWVVGGIGALALLVYVVGAFLPVRHSATLSRVVSGTPEEVWEVITDVKAFPEWRPGVERAQALEPIGGWPAWREEGSEGTLTFAYVGVEPPHRLATEIVDQGLPFGGRWTYVLEPKEGGTEVTVTEDGFVYSPIYRFVSRFFMGFQGTIEAYLDALEARMAGPAV